MIALVNPSTPYPNHVHVDRYGAAEVTRVGFAIETGDKTMSRNPVGAFCENGPAIDYELKCFAGRIGVPVEFNGSQADPSFPTAKDGSVGANGFDLEGIKRLSALAVGPP